MKKIGRKIFIIVLFLIGLGILMYPVISNYINSFWQQARVGDYRSRVTELKQEEYELLLQDAERYNARLYELGISFETIETERKQLLEEGLDYPDILNIGENGMMGYLVIDKIDVCLPISHGSKEEVLKYGVGHQEGSSLPVGGENTHAVLFGHRGLPSAKLFTDLDQMEIGDNIEIHILDRTLVYEVDQILVVEPEETDALQIEAGKDYITLVTCTPYAVNTHRLLVRAQRVEDGRNN